MAYIGQSLTEGTRRVYTYVATAGQTIFNAVYGIGAVDVYQNGILLQPTDYTATDGVTVVLGVGAAVNDEITVVCHNTFSVADTVSASQGGVFNDDVDINGDLTVAGAFTSKGIDDNATSTAMTLDTSGNVTVGRTDVNTFDIVGHGFRSDGVVSHTADSQPVAYINRETNDGDFLVLRKDNATVGGIGTLSGTTYIHSGTVGLTMFDTGGSLDRIYPATSNGNGRDAAIDLGDSSTRFKDLYLSGEAITTGISSQEAHFGSNGGSPYWRAYKDTGVSISSITSSANTYPNWTDANLGWKFRNSNNALSILVGGTVNNRAAVIQAGHGDLAYSNYYSSLYLNKFGGTVYANTTAISDERVKTNLEVIPDALSKVCSLSGYTYYRTDYQTDVQEAGVLAQQVQEVLPCAVTYEEEEDKYGVTYHMLSALFVEAIKDLESQVKQAEERALLAESKLQDIENRITALENQGA
jgi:hypothetical protein